MVGYPSFSEAQRRNHLNACINNMRQIEAGKEQWAMAYAKHNGTFADVSGVNSYIKGGGPKCPNGGLYQYNRIGDLPACSVHGSLSKDRVYR